MAGQPPAQQRLRAHHESAREVDLGLVAQHELVAVERTPQLALEQQALYGHRVHLRSVEDVAIPARALRVVHGRVGIAYQVDHVVAVFGAGGDADARRHVDLVPADVLRPRNLVQEQACQRGGLLVPVARAVRGFGEHCELVAGQPTDDRLLRQDATHALAQGLEHPITGLVSERVVDLLEIVHVEIQQHESAPLAQATRDRLVQQVLELHPVRHLRQRVESREVADAPLGPLALRDVAQHEDPALEARVRARELGCGHRHGNRLPARRADDRLAPAHG